LLSVALSNSLCFHPLGGGQGTPIDANPALVKPPFGVLIFLIFKRISSSVIVSTPNPTITHGLMSLPKQGIFM
jgi:hypothetical protein